jgi:hypothetical protein
VDVFINVNDNLETSLSKDAHGLSIDLNELTCGVQQPRKFSTTTQDAPYFINLQNALVLVNVGACSLARSTSGVEGMLKFWDGV